MKAEICHSDLGRLDYPIHVLKAWVGDMAKAFPINVDFKNKRSDSDYTRDTNEILKRIQAIEAAVKILEKENKKSIFETEEINLELYELTNKKT
jgi:hypothetical protein